MRQNAPAVFALVLVAAAWGATFTLIKHLVTAMAPEPFIFWRFTVAGVILCLVARSRRRLRRELLLPGIILGLLVFAGYWMQTTGLLTISPSRSALLTGLYVVMVPFADRLKFGTDIPWNAWAGSVIATGGTAILIGGFDARPSFGDLLTIACAAIFALHVVLSARYTMAHSATGLAAVQVLFVGLAAAPFAVFAKPTPWSGEIVAIILFTAVVTTALAFVILMWSQARVTATEAAIILAFEPVAAAITSVVWDHEPVTAAFLAGGALVVAGMILSQLRAASSVC